VQFAQRYQQRYPNWTFQATRRKVVSNYWFHQVLSHFGRVAGIAFLVTIPFYHNWPAMLPSAFIGCLISFVTLIGFIYFPSYYSQFLPWLDTIIAEQEKLAVQAEETKKCKRSQFQIPTLIVIYYAFSKMGNIPLLPANDTSGALLNKLFVQIRIN